MASTEMMSWLSDRSVSICADDRYTMHTAQFAAMCTEAEIGHLRQCNVCNVEALHPLVRVFVLQLELEIVFLEIRQPAPCGNRGTPQSTCLFSPFLVSLTHPSTALWGGWCTQSSQPVPCPFRRERDHRTFARRLHQQKGQPARKATEREVGPPSMAET